MDAILWADMSIGILALYWPFAVVHFAPLLWTTLPASQSDAIGGMEQLLWLAGGTADRHAAVSPNLHAGSRSGAQWRGPAARFRPPAPWPHGLASHGHAWSPPTISCRRKAMSKLVLDRGPSSVPIFKISGAQSGAFIVEDDYTSEFRYSGPPL